MPPPSITTLLLLGSLLLRAGAASRDYLTVAPPGTHLKDSLIVAAQQGLAVHLLPGIYDVTETIVLPDNTKLRGNNSFDQRDVDKATLIRNVANAKPIFQGAVGGKFELSGIQFIGRNILDFSSVNGKVKAPSQIVSIRNCAFFTNETLFGRAGAADKWVAIKLTNHDFSVIDRCNLNNYDGFCGIRVAGIRSADDKSGKNTTQIKISDCAIRGSRIGISLDMIDNAKIEGNDFGGSILAGIDLGGRLYDSSAARGMFSNTWIRANHFENCKRSVYAAGFPTSNHRWENWGTRLESNGVFVYGPVTTAKDAVFEFTRCSSVSTQSNSIFIDAGTIPVQDVTVFRLADCHNVRMIGDDVTHNAEAVVMRPEKILADEGGNSGLFFWSGYGGAANQSPRRATTFMKGDLKLKGSIQQEKTAFGASLPDWPGSVLANGQEISLTATLARGDTLRVLDLSEHPTGILTLCVHNAKGTFSSTYSLGSAGASIRLSKVSPESTADVYQLVVDAAHRLVYIPAEGLENLGKTVVSGAFTGLR